MDITRKQAIFLIIAVVFGIGFLIAADQAVDRLSPWGYEDFQGWMHDLNFWAPLVYVLFFAVSMLIVPIPTGPVPIAAAVAFGGIQAFFYTMLDGVLGASLCFWVARRWGRPALQRFLPAKVMQEVDRLSSLLGIRILIILRLFPIFGVDIVSYGAGLTQISFKTYLVISVLASAPTVILVSVVGDGLRENNTLALIGLAALAVFLLIPLIYFAFRQRDSSRDSR